ncbi:MAG TPA: hypothetical protein VK184_14075 [Nostocaceae cyanobacterium]|nr:hypothetical protein [Nostocaceae cyanobacterium]
MTAAKPPVRRGRVFPEYNLSPAELAKQEAEDEAFYKRCQVIFERVRAVLIQEHYGWYIAIVPENEDYLIDEDKEIAHKKAYEKYPKADHCVFCLNETGAVGSI